MASLWTRTGSACYSVEKADLSSQVIIIMAYNLCIGAYGSLYAISE